MNSNPSATTLNNDDWCSRLAHLSQKWEPPAFAPKAILTRAVEHGLISDDPAQAASDEAMRLCTDRDIDTAETDLLGLATHISGLAEMLAWILQGESGPWERPEPISLPDGRPWTTGAFLSRSGRGLRHVMLVDRFDAWREVELRNAWAVQGECAVYDTSMDVIACSIGSMRKRRWVSPFTVGYRHPVAKTLRFQRRDGDGFGDSWDRVARESDKATKEDWLDAMAEDGVLGDCITAFRVEPPERAMEIRELASRKLVRIGGGLPPDPQLSQCFSRLRPCPFRGCCPQGKEPSEMDGFRLRG